MIPVCLTSPQCNPTNRDASVTHLYTIIVLTFIALIFAATATGIARKDEADTAAAPGPTA